MERKEDILNLSAQIYEYIERKMKEHREHAEDVQKGCQKFGYNKFIPRDYVDGYDAALSDLERLLAEIKIGG